MHIGRSIRVALAKHDINQTELARQMGVSRAYINRLCGKETAPMGSASKIAKHFGMKVSEFIALGEDDEPQR